MRDRRGCVRVERRSGHRIDRSRRPRGRPAVESGAATWVSPGDRHRGVPGGRRAGGRRPHRRSEAGDPRTGRRHRSHGRGSGDRRPGPWSGVPSARPHRARQVRRTAGGVRRPPPSPLRCHRGTRRLPRADEALSPTTVEFSTSPEPPGAPSTPETPDRTTRGCQSAGSGVDSTDPIRISGVNTPLTPDAMTMALIPSNTATGP